MQARGDVESGYARGALPAELIHLGGHLQEEATLLPEPGALQSAPGGVGAGVPTVEECSGRVVEKTAALHGDIAHESHVLDHVIALSEADPEDRLRTPCQ